MSGEIRELVHEIAVATLEILTLKFQRCGSQQHVEIQDHLKLTEKLSLDGLRLVPAKQL